MLFINILDIIGVVAFSLAGALIGIEKRLDIFGVFVLSTFTAVGGGLLRDLFLNDGFPVFFTQPKYIIVIIIFTVITCFMPDVFIRFYRYIQLFDAVGLAVITTITANKCMILGVPFIGVIFISVLAGIGGGVLRDIFVNDVPIVFRNEIYALASMIGAIAVVLLNNVLSQTLLIYLCFTIVLTIRLLSIYLKLNVPVIRLKADEKVY